MSENSENTSFRNNVSGCPFNDKGFCKYRERCNKQHFKDKCQELECDRKCVKRHTKACRRGQQCRFYKEKICAYDHEQEHTIIEGEKAIMEKIKSLGLMFENQTK